MPSEVLSVSSRRDFLRTVTVGTALFVANLALPAKRERRDSRQDASACSICRPKNACQSRSGQRAEHTISLRLDDSIIFCGCHHSNETDDGCATHRIRHTPFNRRSVAARTFISCPPTVHLNITNSSSEWALARHAIVIMCRDRRLMSRFPASLCGLFQSRVATCLWRGVGYHPRGKFVHLDSGPFRHW